MNTALRRSKDALRCYKRKKFFFRNSKNGENFENHNLMTNFIIFVSIHGCTMIVHVYFVYEQVQTLSYSMCLNETIYPLTEKMLLNKFLFSSKFGIFCYHFRYNGLKDTNLRTPLDTEISQRLHLF